MKQIFIVVPVRNEADNLLTLYEQLNNKVFNVMPQYDWAILFVDDGSTDNSWEIIDNLSLTNRKVFGLCLSRNFGKEMALTAGIEALKECDAVVCMDADLQHPPEIVPQFVRKWEQGSEVVIGIRKECEDYSLFKKNGSRLFYSIMAKYSELNMPQNSTDFRLIDKKVVSNVCRFTERTRIFRGLIGWMGYEKSFVEFVAPKRNGGKSTYSFKKLLDLAINSFTSFSIFPLRLTGVLGIFIIAISGFLLLYMLLTDFIMDYAYSPLAYVVVFDTLIVGVILVVLGVIAIYIGNIHTEVVQRPLYLIKAKIDATKQLNATVTLPN